MNTLRWILGTSAVLFGGWFLLLALLGHAFRKSLGASEQSPLLISLPLLGLVLLFAAILVPGSKPLLHIAAFAAVALLGVCLCQICGEGGTPLWFAVAYLVAWFTYYWVAAWPSIPQP